MVSRPQEVSPDSEEILHDTVNRREAMIEPHRVADNVRRKPVSAVAGHAVTLPAGGQVDNARAAYVEHVT